MCRKFLKTIKRTSKKHTDKLTVPKAWWKPALSVAAVIAVSVAAVFLALRPGGLLVLWGGDEGTNEVSSIGKPSEVGVGIEKMTKGTAGNPSTDSPFSHFDEVKGYDTYKTDLVKKSGIADKYQWYPVDKTPHIFTYQVLTNGNMTGGRNDTLVVYWLEVKGYYFSIYLLISDNENLYFIPETRDSEPPYCALAQYKFEDMNDDGADELTIYYQSGSAGGEIDPYYITVYQYEGETFKAIPFGSHDTLMAGGFKGNLDDNGYFSILHEETGYKTRLRHNADYLFGSSHYRTDGTFIGDPSDFHCDGISAVEIRDVNRDGICEILVSSAYYALIHSESFGHGFEVYQYDRETGRFHAKKVLFVREEDMNHDYFIDFKSLFDWFIIAAS